MKHFRKILASAVAAAALTVGMAGSALAYTGPATVATDGLNLREGASLDYNVIDCLPRGAVINVNFDAGYDWYQVTYNGKTGYMAGYYLLFGDTGAAAAPKAAAAEEVTPVLETAAAPAPTAAPTPAATPAPTAPAEKVTLTGSGAGIIRGTEIRLRSGPSKTSETVGFLTSGDKVAIHGICGDWYEIAISGISGYVYKDYVTPTGQQVTYNIAVEETIDNTAPYTPAPAATPAPTPAPAAEEKPAFVHNPAAGQAIVDTAMEYLGVPYVWAGTSPSGFDCSGLVYYVYGLHGYSLNRVAQAMYKNGVDVDISNIKNLQAGDILLFGSSVYNIWHAAIYVGDGVFIHAPYSGQVVRTQGLSETYGMRLVAARRIV